MSDDQIQRKLAAIFLADVVGYSRLMRDDEMATFNTLSSYREVMGNLIRQHRGRVVDTSGDNLLAEFSSVVDAMQSAVSIQKELRARNTDLPEHRKMEFRIGINIGDVIQEGERIYGDGVNIAARLEGLADPGGICISRMAYDQIESKLPLGYEYIGEQVVKNISKPLHAYRVLIDPQDSSHQQSATKSDDFKRTHSHFGHEVGGKRFEESFHKFKRHLKDFAKDMKEDEQLSESFEEIKGRVRTFADDMASSPEGRRRELHNLIHDKHLKFFLGIACFLFFINAFTSFGSWWFQFPLATVGLVIYLYWLRASFLSAERTNAMRTRLLQKELSRLNQISRDSQEGRAQAEVRVAARVRFYKHVYVYVGVNAFLLVINLLTSPFNWWFHFPLLGWGVGLFFHWIKLK